MELHSLSCFDPQLRPMWIRTIRLATREETMTIAQGFPTQKQIAMVDRRLRKKNTRCLHVASTESTVFRVQPFGPAWFKGGIDMFIVTSHDPINTSNLRCHQTQPGNPPTQRSIFQETSFDYQRVTLIVGIHPLKSPLIILIPTYYVRLPEGNCSGSLSLILCERAEHCLRALIWATLIQPAALIAGNPPG